MIRRIRAMPWGLGEKLKSSEANALDENVTYALDKRPRQTDTLESDVTVTGHTLFQGQTDVSGALNVSGRSTFTGPVEADGPTRLAGPTEVAGATHASGVIDIASSSTVTGKLSAAGNGYITLRRVPSLPGLRSLTGMADGDMAVADGYGLYDFHPYPAATPLPPDDLYWCLHSSNVRGVWLHSMMNLPLGPLGRLSLISQAVVDQILNASFRSPAFQAEVDAEVQRQLGNGASLAKAWGEYYLDAPPYGNNQDIRINALDQWGVSDAILHPNSKSLDITLATPFATDNFVVTVNAYGVDRAGRRVPITGSAVAVPTAPDGFSVFVNNLAQFGTNGWTLSQEDLHNGFRTASGTGMRGVLTFAAFGA